MMGLRAMILALVALMATCHGALGQSMPDPRWLLDGALRASEAVRDLPREQPFWKASLGALVAASVVDVHSSWGKPESNPLLANGTGHFGARAVVLKAAVAGLAVGVQWAMVKRNPRSARYLTISNAAMTAFYAGVAVHNYRNKGDSNGLAAGPAR